MGRFRIILNGEGIHPTEARGEKETDAGSILQLNTECLVPQTETAEAEVWSCAQQSCKISRTNV